MSKTTCLQNLHRNNGAENPQGKASTADVTYVSVIPEVLGIQPRLRQLILPAPPKYTREANLIESYLRNIREG